MRFPEQISSWSGKPLRMMIALKKSTGSFILLRYFIIIEKGCQATNPFQFMNGEGVRILGMRSVISIIGSKYSGHRLNLSKGVKYRQNSIFNITQFN